MLNKYILIITSLFLYVPCVFAQNTIDDYFDSQDGYFSSRDVNINNISENIGTGINFQKDNSLTDGENSLVEAIFYGDIKKASSLLNGKTNPNILYSLVKNNEVIGKTTLLHLAIASGNLEIFRILLVSGNIDLNLKGTASIEKNNNISYQEISPLAYAIYLNKLDMAEALLKKGANPNTYAIFFATSDEAIALLKKYKADLNLENNNKSRPLFEAVKNHDSQLVSLLIKHGANINMLDGHGNGLLYTAITLGYFDMARFLIDNGAGINTPSGKNKITPLMATLSKENHDTGFLRYIIFKGANVSSRDVNGQTPLFYLYKYNNQADIDNIKASLDVLIENGASINAQDKKGNTILHIKPEDYYNIYSKYSPNINIQNNDGNTPLHLAVAKNNFKAILIGNPNKSIKNNKGQTALDIAKSSGLTEAITYLELSNRDRLLLLGAEFGDAALVEKAIQEKLDVNKKIKGHYPIYYAAKGGSPAVFIKLVVAGAKLNLEPNLVNSVLDGFIQGKDQTDRVQLARIFIEKEAKNNWQKYNHLLYALIKKQTEENKGQGFIVNVLRIAIENNININIRDEKGQTPLMIAAGGKYESYDLVLELINAGADIDVRDNNNNTALYYAAGSENDHSKSFIAILNNSKIDINKRYGEKGNTLLMEAALKGNKIITMMLIARGADDSLTNYDNKTALMLAKEKLATFNTSLIDTQNSKEYQNYKYIATHFLSDKNIIAECRSGINEECRKYYKPVDVIIGD